MRAGKRNATALLLGFALDRALGDPRRGHPVAGFGAVSTSLERLSWRDARQAGVLHVALLLMPACWIGRRAAGGLAGVSLTVWITLGGRTLERAGSRMAELLEAGDLAKAREHAPTLVGRDPRELQTAELCRATVESVAENTADAVTGVLLWSALAGAPGAALYRAANTLDAMIGHRSPRYERFGWAAARLDDLLTWPAARLTAMLAVLLAPLAGCDGAAALRVARADGARHPSPNAGLIEAAFAGALGVQLGGVNRYPSHVEHRPTLGLGRAPAVEDIARAVRLSRLIGTASAIVCSLLAIAIAPTRADAPDRTHARVRTRTRLHAGPRTGTRLRTGTRTV